MFLLQRAPGLLNPGADLLGCARGGAELSPRVPAHQELWGAPVLLPPLILRVILLLLSVELICSALKSEITRR